MRREEEACAGHSSKLLKVFSVVIFSIKLTTNIFRCSEEELQNSLKGY